MIFIVINIINNITIIVIVVTLVIVIVIIIKNTFNNDTDTNWIIKMKMIKIMIPRTLSATKNNDVYHIYQKSRSESPRVSARMAAKEASVAGAFPSLTFSWHTESLRTCTLIRSKYQDYDSYSYGIARVFWSAIIISFFYMYCLPILAFLHLSVLPQSYP